MRTLQLNLSRRVLSILAAVVVVVVGPLGNAAFAAADHADAVQDFTRDVYVIDGVTLRNPTVDTDPGQTLFTNSGIRLERAPDDPITWGEWSAATAASTVHTIGGSGGSRTDVRLQLGGLIAGGLYSVFRGTLGPDSQQPLCQGVERTLPLDGVHPAPGAPDANSFVVPASGAVDFHGRAPGALLDADQVFFSIVYHFSGQASYPFPNRGELLTQGDQCRSSFGEDSMRQLLVLQKI